MKVIKMITGAICPRDIKIYLQKGIFKNEKV